ncbi:VOC family protein [Phycicoccus sp. CSK15P-2]|uniref:VOC family protein n=1 Tax=Phycicoccus sp. CSK15P-2 TaxID=2807627 RepID=UPI001950D04C|nr:VOC family protein [Phycicoccus sp. CSK15P-2]MBM6404945.1 VOC family protein [Phycicoccus sp. CSK15P-2]
MTEPLAVRWPWLFLDTPRADAETSWRFWSEATGLPVLDRRGHTDEFATLGVHAGDPWVKLQAVDRGPGGIHLDLDVDDVEVAARTAVALGADRTGAVGDTVVVLRSPAGLPFCLTTWQGEQDLVRDGADELVDQVCLDLPRDVHDDEAAFWRDLTGWEQRWFDDEPELSALRRAPGMPVRLLLQRLDEDSGPARGHVDVACADRRSSVARHVAAGAEVVREHEGWTVMRDPVGRVYCLTGRSPQAPAGE